MAASLLFLGSRALLRNDQLDSLPEADRRAQ